MVIMDDERRAAWAAIKARSHEVLDPDACRAAVAAETARVHRDDGFSCDWAATMPKQPEPEPASRTLTDTEIARMIASVQADFDSKLAAALEARVSWEHARQDAIGRALSEIRKQLREEIGQLRADVTIATKAAERRERGDVVEVIPQFLQRRRHDAA
jgi:hypothetical protein